MTEEHRALGGCDYLNQEHHVLRAAPRLRTFAAHTLFDAVIRCSDRFRLDFDRSRLEKALGQPTLSALLPTLPSASIDNSALTTHEEHLDAERAALIRCVLSFELEGWSEPPINHVDRVVFFDVRGRVMMRANDSCEFILFALPEPERRALLERYEEQGIPADVVERVLVDIQQGL